jgi:hypothetical protein
MLTAFGTQEASTIRSRLEPNVGIGGCASPQPRFDSSINELARRAFSFLTNPFQALRKETLTYQSVSGIPTAIPSRFQKLHGTKLAQNGTKFRAKMPC